MQTIETKLRILQVEDTALRQELLVTDNEKAQRFLNDREGCRYQWKSARTRARISRVQDTLLRLDLLAKTEREARELLDDYEQVEQYRREFEAMDPKQLRDMDRLDMMLSEPYVEQEPPPPDYLDDLLMAIRQMPGKLLKLFRKQTPAGL